MSDDAVKTNGFNKQKVGKARRDWEAADRDYEEAVAAAKTERGEQRDDILAVMEEIGVKRNVFKAMTKEAELIGKAEAIRDRFAEDEALQDQYDNVRVAAGVTTLFGDDLPVQTNPKKKKAPVKKSTPKFSVVATEV